MYNFAPIKHFSLCPTKSTELFLRRRPAQSFSLPLIDGRSTKSGPNWWAGCIPKFLAHLQKKIPISIPSSSPTSGQQATTHLPAPSPPVASCFDRPTPPAPDARATRRRRLLGCSGDRRATPPPGRGLLRSSPSLPLRQRLPRMFSQIPHLVPQPYNRGPWRLSALLQI